MEYDTSLDNIEPDPRKDAPTESDNNLCPECRGALFHKMDCSRRMFVTLAADPSKDAPTEAVENPAWRKERDARVAALDEEIREMTDNVEQQGEEIAKAFEAVQHYARLASSNGDPGSAAIALATVTRSLVAREMQSVQMIWDLQDKRKVWGD